MKVKLTALLLCLLLLLSSCTVHKEKPSVVKLPEPKEASAYAIAEALSAPEFEGRAAGSPSNLAAAKWIADFFEKAGLDPLGDEYLLPYEDLIALPTEREARASVLDSDGREHQMKAGVDFFYRPPRADICRICELSTDPAHCKAGGTALLDDVNNGTDITNDMDFIRVCCLDPDNIKNETLEGRTNYETSMSVMPEYYKLLQQPGARLSLDLPMGAEIGTAYNPAAVLRGSEGKNAVLIGAHFDGIGKCGDTVFPGAYDNASGTAVMLRTAALAAQSAPALKNDVVFVAFNGEESLMEGSEAFADLIASKYEHVAFINIDCVGNSDIKTLMVHGGAADAALRDALSASLTPLTTAETSEESLPGDTQSFVGKPNVSFAYLSDEGVSHAPPNERRLHTAEDTPDLLDAERLEQMAEGIADFIGSGGDNIYEHDSAFEDDLMYAAQEAERAALLADGTLKNFSDVYFLPDCYGVAYTGYHTFSSPEELAELFPCYRLPSKIGDYRFLLAQEIPLCRGDNYTTTFFISGHEEGLFNMTDELVPNSLDALYAAEDGMVVWLQVNSYSYPRLINECGEKLGSAYKNYSVWTEYLQESGRDGYALATLPLGDGRFASLTFLERQNIVIPETIYQRAEIDHRRCRFISADELTALLDSFDLSSVLAD